MPLSFGVLLGLALRGPLIAVMITPSRKIREYAYFCGKTPAGNTFLGTTTATDLSLARADQAARAPKRASHDLGISIGITICPQVRRSAEAWWKRGGSRRFGGALPQRDGAHPFERRPTGTGASSLREAEVPLPWCGGRT
ncbi:hypothetical protein [Yinghuangia seranimata]|uniref:hypothetical protein n=1 Tax=Yinghuangia seranimata TaxID=408067 RepID=UPI00248BA2FE|nr:hypothetical protein [Yinghuangia seranimata]MDI2128362.1 hypothetical protein [Yinghuangia seranimata]